MMEIKREIELGSFISLLINLVRTKLFNFRSRLIRFPLYCKGRKYIDWGRRLTTGVGCRIDAMRLEDTDPPELRFGDDVQLNDYVHICALKSVTIGNDVLIASHVYISDNSHGSYKGDRNDSLPLVSPIHREYRVAPVVINDRVWIGEGVMILPGVTIGEGAIIGAHSVVSHDIPSNSIAIGAPAKVVKKFNFHTHRWERV